jgi:hypothetical protein
MTRFAHALFGILPAWRRLCDRQLPLWRFHRRRQRLHRVEALRAELRCGQCDARARCRSRIAHRRAGPVAGCPNASLFAIR